MIRPLTVALALGLCACGNGTSEPAQEPDTPEAVVPQMPDDGAAETPADAAASEPETDTTEASAERADEPSDAPAAPPLPAPPRPTSTADGITLAQMQGRVLAAFTRLDSDNDGLLSQAEVAAAPGPTGQMLDRADLNGDGQLSRGEIEAGMAARFQALDTNGDGILTDAERPEPRPGRMF